MGDREAITARLTRAGLNLIGQALSIYDGDLRLAVSNRMYADLFALPEALTRPGTPFAETIRFLVERGEYGEVDDLDAFVADRVAQALAFEPHYLERTRPTGQVIAVEGSPLPQGGWVTVYTDITAVKAQERLLRARSEVLSDQLLERHEEVERANRALAATNVALAEARRDATEMAARIRLTTEMLPAHIARLNRDRRYTFSNRRLGAVMPGARSEIVGLTMEEALGGPTYAVIEPHLTRALDGAPSVFEMTHDPSSRRIRVSFTPDMDEVSGEGSVTGVYALSVDITEEAQARAALAQAAGRQVAAQLTSGMAHDFANLLTVILGLKDKLGAMDLPPGARDAVSAIGLAATRGGHLIDQLSALSGPARSAAAGHRSGGVPVGVDPPRRGVAARHGRLGDRRRRLARSGASGSGRAPRRRAEPGHQRARRAGRGAGSDRGDRAAGPGHLAGDRGARHRPRLLRPGA